MTPDERAWLRDFLAFDEDRGRRKRRSSALWNETAGSFPSGLIPHVKRAAKLDGLTVEVVDRRAVPCPPDVAADTSWLRDYQRAAVDAILASTRGVVHLPTGAGKTELAVALARVLPCRWLFVAHRKDLMHQAADRYELRTGDVAGRVGDGLWDVRRFTVATYQSIAAALRAKDKRAEALLSATEGAVFDEAHVVGADQFWRIAMRTKSAYWRVGLSGTPFDRTDQRSILVVAAIGPRVFRLRPGDLIDEGVLARPRIRMVACPQGSVDGGWSDVYRELVVGSRQRNDLLAQLALRAAKPCLLFVKEIDHGEALARALERARVKVEFVWGDVATERRQAAVRRLTRGDVDVLVCSVIFQEGIDIPALASVVVGSAGKSTIAALQRIGRGMRTDGGRKMEFEVWDVLDKGDPWLEKHARRRMKAYVGEGHEVVVDGGAPAAQVQLRGVAR